MRALSLAVSFGLGFLFNHLVFPARIPTVNTLTGITLDYAKDPGQGGPEPKQLAELNVPAETAKLKHTQKFDEGSSPVTCMFEHYTPSALEESWVQNVEQWQGDVCAHTPKPTIEAVLAKIHDVYLKPEDSVAVTNSRAPPLERWDGLLSVHTYKRSDGKFVHVPIGPDWSINRDPRKCLSVMTETYTQSKAHLLPLSAAAAECTHTSGSPRAFLFDAGATWATPEATNEGLEGTSRWSGTGFLIDWYKQRGINFTEIYAWEPNARRVPTAEEAGELLHFYTVGVTDQEGAEHNPLTRISQLCKPQDLVVFKLDIDSQWEHKIARDLLSTPELLALVDDFYFEHHVYNNVMRMHGLGGNGNAGNNLASWYGMSHPARKKGLRIGAWP